MYKFVSLDFWHTLAEPNEEYREARTVLLSTAFGISDSMAVKLWNQVKKSKFVASWPSAAFKLNRGPEDPLSTALDLFIELLAAQTRPLRLRPDVKWTVYEKLTELFIRYPPVVTKTAAEQILRLHDEGVVFCISSNLGLMDGKTMRQVIHNYYLPINRFIFDREVGAPKPSSTFWAHVRFAAGDHNIYPQAMLHIGDDPKLDAATDFRYSVIRNQDDFVEQLRQLEGPNVKAA